MFTVIIPSRYQSVRLPGKALKDIAGKPMVQHVYERARCSSAAQVVVATDDERIADVVRGFGGSVCMTRVDHASGTDRLQEAAVLLGLGADSVVVNVQGDEPLIPPEVIDQVAENIQRSGAALATLFETITSAEDFLDPAIVKVVTDQAGYALYFSRAPIPFQRDGAIDASTGEYKRHLGIYAYRVSTLNDFVTWPQPAFEAMEKLEQLRALWQGVRIHCAEAVVSIPPGVDTERDLQRVITFLGAKP